MAAKWQDLTKRTLVVVRNMADAELGDKKELSSRQYHVLMVQTENLSLFQVYLYLCVPQFRLWNVFVTRQTVIFTLPYSKLYMVT